MEKRMSSWFFMRPGFDTFELQPETHSRYLFGKRDRRQRDHLLTSLEEASYSNDGYKAAVYGDYGRGKTHQCHNIIFEVGRRGMRFLPIYMKCGAFKKKEPFNTLFRELVTRHSTAELNRVACEYLRRANEKKTPPLEEITKSEDIGAAMSRGLTAPNPEAVKITMRWLGGDPKIDLTMLGTFLKPQLTESGDFGAVMRGIAHMFIEVDGKVPLYIIDEAERFNLIADTDTFYSWLAAMRELTELHGVAMIFMIGAKTRDQLPTLFVADEIVRRIGVSNYLEFLNPGREEIREFLLEQFQTSILKGAVPELQRDVAEPSALVDRIPEELQSIVGDQQDRLESYPFEPDAFNEFVAQVAGGEMANKPSEAQKRLQKAAQRAMRLGKRMIDVGIVQQLDSEAF